VSWLPSLIAACKTARVQPSADLIRAQLDRILASPQFAGSARMVRFLRYVVERALAGEAERLKEYVVGVEVFDRGKDYDPRVDSIVRVEAGRLRGKLEEYYREAGSSDAVRILLKKGGYAPVFEQQEAAPAALIAAPMKRSRAWVFIPLSVTAAVATLLLVVKHDGSVSVAPTPDVTQAPAAPPVAVPTGPVIAVLPFVPYGEDAAAEALGERLTEGVTAELVRAGVLQVVSSSRSARFRDPRSIPDDIGDQLGAQALLRCRVTIEGGQLRVDAVVMDGDLGRKPWAGTFTGAVDRLDGLAQQIAREVSAAVASRYPHR
jgi:adenylate cyclase